MKKLLLALAAMCAFASPVSAETTPDILECAPPVAEVGPLYNKGTPIILIVGDKVWEIRHGSVMPEQFTYFTETTRWHFGSNYQWRGENFRNTHLYGIGEINADTSGPYVGRYPAMYFYREWFYVDGQLTNQYLYHCQNGLAAVLNLPPITQIPGGNAPTNDHYYTNRDGNTVHSPSDTYNGMPPDGATAQCADGTYSFSEHRSGTCSHHGGIR